MGPTRKLAVAVLILAALALLAPAHAEKKKKEKDTTLAGLIYTTATSNRPTNTGYDAVEGVELTLDGTQYKATTDVRGMFEFKGVPDGDYMLVARKPGYSSLQKPVKVEGGSFPTTLQLVMNPVGTIMVNDVPITQGTVYVAFAARGASLAMRGDGGQDFPRATQQLFRGAVAAGADPLAIAGNAPPEMRGPNVELNPTSTEPNSLMIFPPASPMKTGFQTMHVQPYWVAFNKPGSILYVSTAAQQISVYDVLHGQALLRNLPAQGFVTDLRCSPDGRYMLASVLSPTPNVLMIDTQTQDPVGLVPCPPPHGNAPAVPSGVAMSPDGMRLYVLLSASQGGEVAAVDPASGQPLGFCPVGGNPTGMVLSPDGRLLFVANSGSASVSVVDALGLTEVTRIQVGVNPQKVAISPDGQRIFVTNKQSNSVSVIDGRSLGVIATTQVGQGPVGVAVSPDGTRAFVTCKEEGTVVMLDAKNGGVLHTTVPMPNSSPWGLAIKP